MCLCVCARRMVNSEHINCSSTWQHLCISHSQIARLLYLSWGVFVHSIHVLHYIVYIMYHSVTANIFTFAKHACSLNRLCPHIRFAPIWYNSNGAKCELNRDLNHCLYANMNLNCANYIYIDSAFKRPLNRKGMASKLCATTFIQSHPHSHT